MKGRITDDSIIEYQLRNKIRRGRYIQGALALHPQLSDGIPCAMISQCSYCDKIFVKIYKIYHNPSYFSKENRRCPECHNKPISETYPLSEALDKIDIGKLFGELDSVANMVLYKDGDVKKYFKNKATGLYYGIKKNERSFYCPICRLQIKEENVFVNFFKGELSNFTHHPIRGRKTYHIIRPGAPTPTCSANTCPVCEKAVIDISAFNGYCSEECQTEGIKKYMQIMEDMEE
jgi:hypothetical protein